MPERDLFDEARAQIRGALAGASAKRRALELPGFRPASVLIAILRRPEGPAVLFTRRTETVHDHKGQISFPGGRREDGEDAAGAALREAHEEVGLDPATVEVAGFLDDRATVSWYVVTPVIGIVREPPPAYVHQESEVLEPFEVPLARLLDRSRFRHEWWDVSRMPPDAPSETLLKLRSEIDERDPDRRAYKVYFFDAAPAGAGPIWGLTARILKDFLDRAFGFSRAGGGPAGAR